MEITKIITSFKKVIISKIKREKIIFGYYISTKERLLLLL
jgi:hypothetical protein